jgi:hypothetical protein
MTKNTGAWKGGLAKGEDIHVLPVGDLREHQEQRYCWCRPRVDRTERCCVVVHNAADGRELIELHGLQ